MASMDETRDAHDCSIKLRINPKRRKEKVYIGCGAGFGGDRPVAALKMLQRVEELDYLVLECLAERTLAERYHAMKSGGKGYDPRITEWMQLLLPLAVERGVCIISNMGAKDPRGAQEAVLQIATKLGLSISVGIAYQSSVSGEGLDNHPKCVDGDASVYLGAAPIVECLEKFRPNVIITSRVADASLFLGPMVYELGWNWNELQLLAQGSLAGHLLECGCQLTGGYYMHPGDKHRNLSFHDLLDLSPPYVEVTFDGIVCVGKAGGSGGVLNLSTCSQQLLYEVGDPSAYITPDVIIDLRDVTFQQLSKDKILCTGAKPSAESVPQKLLLLSSKDSGWKGWGEISYGGFGCVQRAKLAELLVRSWIEEIYSGISDRIISYIIGVDSLKAGHVDDLPTASTDIRLRMDGLFEHEEHAIQLTKEFIALYTNGPAGGGGISTGHKKEIFLEKRLLGRECVHWQVAVAVNNLTSSSSQKPDPEVTARTFTNRIVDLLSFSRETTQGLCNELSAPRLEHGPAISGQKIPLYNIVHSRTGDKGNDLNFSLIPHFPPDIKILKMVITPEWVKKTVLNLLNPTSFPEPQDIEKRDKWASGHVKVEIYDVPGIRSLNVVVRNILDGGVNCSRRIDRHGKTISDLILCQHVVLPQ